MHTILREYFGKFSPVAPKVEGRITANSSWWIPTRRMGTSLVDQEKFDALGLDRINVRISAATGGTDIRHGTV
jgi:hypothetical protein